MGKLFAVSSPFAEDAKTVRRTAGGKSDKARIAAQSDAPSGAQRQVYGHGLHGPYDLAPERPQAVVEKGGDAVHHAWIEARPRYVEPVLVAKQRIATAIGELTRQKAATDV
jgi:hypothetical protein